MQPAFDAREEWMRAAMAQARKAAILGEVPIGAVAVREGAIIGAAHNLREQTRNPLGHAELLLIDSLAKELHTWRLDDVTIVVTCEPCLMCAGAMLQARVPRVLFGCRDPKAGAMGTLYDVAHDPRLNHRIEVVSGVLAEECADLLSDFFRNLRNRE